MDNDDQTPTTGSDMDEKARVDIQIAKGTMFLEECQVLHIVIYTRSNNRTWSNISWH